MSFDIVSFDIVSFGIVSFGIVSFGIVSFDNIVFLTLVFFPTRFFSGTVLVRHADPYSEADAATVMKNIFSAVRHLHVSRVQYCPFPHTFPQGRQRLISCCNLFTFFGFN